LNFRFTYGALPRIFLGFIAATVTAADYPTRRLRIIVPFTAAGPTDVLARMIAKHLTEA
jgi:tripartite-type tricarboxylate transporter receptor subunit TctC